MNTQGFILFFHYNHFYFQAPVICTLQYVYFTINFKKETKSLEAEGQCCALAIVQVRRGEGFKQGSGSDREDRPAEGLEEAPYVASGLSGGWREKEGSQ